MSIRERLRELHRKWFRWGEQEIRHTTVGWKRDARYIEDKSKTPSGNSEYYRVVRKAKDNGNNL